MIVGYGANLSVKELKRLANEIVNEESRKYNLNVNVFPVTFIEYYTDYIFDDKFSLKKLNAMSDYVYIRLKKWPFAFYRNKDIVIILNKIKKYEKIDSFNSIFFLVFVIYHELRHNMQDYNAEFSYEYFLSGLEGYLKLGDYSEMNYKRDHDDFSNEIGANLYGIQRAKDYLINKYPEIYELEKKHIEWREKNYIFNYFMYDASRVFDLAVPIIRSRIKTGIICEETLFMDRYGNFKSIRKIFCNPVYNNLDKRIVASVMSSKIFLRELDYENLSYDELKVLSDMVNYTNTIYDNQLMYLEEIAGKGAISDSKVLSKKQGIIKRKKELEFYIDKIGLYMSIARIVDKKKNRS